LEIKVWGKRVKDKVSTHLQSEYLKGKDRLEDQGTDGSIILRVRGCGLISDDIIDLPPTFPWCIQIRNREYCASATGSAGTYAGKQPMRTDKLVKGHIFASALRMRVQAKVFSEKKNV
jgi:hypothetical protein